MNRRLFYAIEFPEIVQRNVYQAAQKLAASAQQGSWTRAENFHLTLQFIGDCPDEWIPGLSAILYETAAGCHPFSIDIYGCGSFGRQQDILWFGVAREPQLLKIAVSLTDKLEQQRFPCEKRPFAPHITIGRQVRMDPAFCREWTWPAISCPVKNISLMESTRIQGLLTYRPVLRVPFSP